MVSFPLFLLFTFAFRFGWQLLGHVCDHMDAYGRSDRDMGMGMGTALIGAAGTLIKDVN